MFAENQSQSIRISVELLSYILLLLMNLLLSFRRVISPSWEKSYTEKRAINGDGDV